MRMPEETRNEVSSTLGERADLPAGVAAAIVEAIRRRGIDALSVEHVSELTGLDALTICERWGDIEMAWPAIAAAAMPAR
jgi:hypothetical protein